MNDPAQYNVEIHSLQRELEELLAYMAPTALQRERIKFITGRIAICAVSIGAFYA